MKNTRGKRQNSPQPKDEVPTDANATFRVVLPPIRIRRDELETADGRAAAKARLSKQFDSILNTAFNVILSGKGRKA